MKQLILLFSLVMLSCNISHQNASGKQAPTDFNWDTISTEQLLAVEDSGGYVEWSHPNVTKIKWLLTQVGQKYNVDPDSIAVSTSYAQSRLNDWMIWESNMNMLEYLYKLSASTDTESYKVIMERYVAKRMAEVPAPKCP